ncbi:hypothetical protein LOK49_LG10G01108 [Camellia lanceoleosa]|uniref:Uncharacterized protein n=2 Tax=Camellia lanceoleosa TaxID=1840588 RepID=A0ACC0G957_9ERIC|nr:hypothetical protein LOK49_LG10G01108 [Camellia lanceoleosa]
MMAAAEARAAWQRTTNRCFVQEDAKRAPKLACCPSASSSSKQVDAGPANTADGHANPNTKKRSLSKLSKLLAGVPNGNCNHLSAVSKLHEYWFNGQNAVVIDDQVMQSDQI